MFSIARKIFAAIEIVHQTYVMVKSCCGGRGTDCSDATVINIRYVGALDILELV